MNEPLSPAMRRYLESSKEATLQAVEALGTVNLPACCESVAEHTKTTRANPTPQDYRIEARQDCFERISNHLWRLEDFKVVEENNGHFYYTLDRDKLALVLGLGMVRK